MKKFISLLLTMLIAIVPLSAIVSSGETQSESQVGSRENATITFRNNSEYSLTIKIVKQNGQLYYTVSLDPHSAYTVNFHSSATYDLKIKATKYGSSSYHDGGGLSVVCTDYQCTQGTMTFQMSSYGSGLGPGISAQDFDKY